MDINMELSDFGGSKITGDGIEWVMDNVFTRFSMKDEERVAFLHEWLEAEEDYEEGAKLRILRVLANEIGPVGFEVT